MMTHSRLLGDLLRPAVWALLSLALALSLVACDDGGGDGDADSDADSDADADPGAEPGSQCNCDSDCRPEPGFRVVCVGGLCMSEASEPCAEPGTFLGCAPGSRCWMNNDDSAYICWPDCESWACSGDCDADGSCVPSWTSCDPACGSFCGGDCVPDCAGRQCGPDGCGGLCGPGCELGDTCNNGVCEPGDPGCIPLQGVGCDPGSGPSCCREGMLVISCLLPDGLCCVARGTECTGAGQCCPGDSCVDLTGSGTSFCQNV